MGDFENRQQSLQAAMSLQAFGYDPLAPSSTSGGQNYAAFSTPAPTSGGVTVNMPQMPMIGMGQMGQQGGTGSPSAGLGGFRPQGQGESAADYARRQAEWNRNGGVSTSWDPYFVAPPGSLPGPWSGGR